MNKKGLSKIMNTKLMVLMIFGLILITHLGTLAWAAEGDENEGVNVAAAKLNQVFCNIAHLIFMIAGAIAALVMIMAGLRWVTSADDPGARNAAKTTIISAIIGLVIIMIAVYIVALVVNGMLPGGQVDPVDWMSGDCASLGETDGGNDEDDTTN